MNEIPLELRLAVLQQYDSHRVWHALSDQRVCVRCGRAFTGTEVKVVSRADGTYELGCASDHCDSNPEHWFFSGSGLGQEEHLSTEAPRQTEVDFTEW
jgi:hypothetical protein